MQIKICTFILLETFIHTVPKTTCILVCHCFYSYSELSSLRQTQIYTVPYGMPLAANANAVIVIPELSASRGSSGSTGPDAQDGASRCQSLNLSFHQPQTWVSPKPVLVVLVSELARHRQSSPAPPAPTGGFFSMQKTFIGTWPGTRCRDKAFQQKLL